ncbi:MAG: membrane dipeptidase [Pseudomonadota bacterium]
MTPLRIDALQYCNWSREIFAQMRAGGLDAVHATIAYHEGFRETVDRITAWHRHFRDHADLIAPARNAAEIRAARASGRTAILFGAQNPQVIENDIGLVGILHQLGLSFMQLTYNNQSLLGTGWQEAEDTGLTRMGREVLAEMNRLGMIADLSHAGERTVLDAIAASGRPVAVTHANPRAWRDTGRNVSDRVMDALAESGGMLGFSLYPHHLAGGSECTRAAFCEMVARTAERMGVDRLGIGSDLCQGRPDSTVEWMRTGRWTHARSGAAFPKHQAWFRDNRDWPGLAEGLLGAGFNAEETGKILGGNWMGFFDANLGS